MNISKVAWFLALLTVTTVCAATDRNHPELAPDDGQWHLWLFSPFVDNASDHDAIYPSFYCIKNVGNNGTHTEYDLYPYLYAAPQDTAAYGYQEGDQFFFHAEFPEKPWPSGSKNPPSLVSFHGQMIGGKNLDPFQLDRVQVFKSGISEILTWNPIDIYQGSFAFNVHMRYFGNTCKDENFKRLLEELRIDYDLEKAFSYLNAQDK